MAGGPGAAAGRAGRGDRVVATTRFHGQELRLIDIDLGQVAVGRPEVLRLMTRPGVDATVAALITVDRGRGRGLHPLPHPGEDGRLSRAQPAGAPVRRAASHGRITKAGPAHARGMLVEAAWSACKAAGPLRAFYQRVQARRGMQVAVVAITRKLTVLWLASDQQG